MALAKSFRELDVYRRALKEAKSIFVTTKDFPREEMYSLTDQVRRSSRAVGAMLAEAWARRRYQAALIDKVNQALAEAMETQAWLDHACVCDYIDDETYRERDDAWQHIGAILQRMIQNADAFCRNAS